MALPSQTARFGASRSPMFRRKRSSPRPFVIGGGIVITTIVVAAVWSLGGTRPVDATPPLSSTDRVADAGTRSATPPPATPPIREPVKREQKPDPKPEQKAEPKIEPKVELKPAPPPAPPAEYKPVVIHQGQAGRDAAAASSSEASRSPAPASEPVPRPPTSKTDEPRPATPTSPAQANPAPANPGPAIEQKPNLPASPPLAAPGPTERDVGGGLRVSNLPAEVQGLVLAGRQKADAHELVPARQFLSRALAHPATPESERALLRDEIAKLNEELVFSPRAAADDPFVSMYAVQSGDGLERIAKRNGVLTHWRLIQRVNRLSNPNKIRLNQKLKLVKGPFHAVVSKAAFRMDIYMGPPDAPAEWLFIRSFRVGLGKDNGTPLGDFVVRKGSKLENPYWTNPRTGEQFSKDDPKNPIGERWIGLDGVGDSAVHASYGIHGTIEPDSIGQERSMGCIRLGAEDVELVYDMLGEGVSRVKIAP